MGGLPQLVVVAVQLVLEGPDLVPVHLDMVLIRLGSQTTAHLVLEAPDRLHLAVHKLNSSAPHLFYYSTQFSFDVMLCNKWKKKRSGLSATPHLPASLEHLDDGGVPVEPGLL